MSEINWWSKEHWNLTEQARFEEAHGLQKAREMALAAGFTERAFKRLGLDDETPAPSLIGAFSKESGETFEKNRDKPHEPTEEQKEQAHFTREVAKAQNARNLAARKARNMPGWKSARS